MSDLGKTVGANQKDIRTARGLSLDALAKASGVSRSHLAQIESGKANPSIGTVWQIATALKVGFTELVATEEGGSQVVDVREHQPLTSNDGTYRAYPVFAFDPALGFELYTCEIDSGGTMAAEPHPTGTLETITIMEGRLTLRVSGEEFEVAADQAIRFRADQPHEYANLAQEPLRFSMVLAYARRSQA